MDDRRTGGGTQSTNGLHVPLKGYGSTTKAKSKAAPASVPSNDASTDLLRRQHSDEKKADDRDRQDTALSARAASTAHKEPDDHVASRKPSRTHRSSLSAGSNTLTETLASDPFFGKPPVVQRQRSLDDDRRELQHRNHKFTKDKKQQWHQRTLSPLNTAGTFVDYRNVAPSVVAHRPSWPSPTAAFRKRLESIDENVHANGSVVAAASPDRGTSPLDPRRSIDNINVPPSGHVREFSDDMSELSQTSADYTAVSNHSMASTLLHQQRMERFESYEQRQKRQFEEAKQDIQSRLLNVLDRSVPPSEKEKNEFIRDYMKELENEREALMAKWKAELEAEQHSADLEYSAWSNSLIYQSLVQPAVESVLSYLSWLECFLANLPLTIGALALAWVTMGTVWFKYMEEMSDFCTPVPFNSDRCSFPEYPGCFECDRSKDTYQLAVGFHYLCSTVSGVFCLAFLFKVVLAWRVVAEELSNPTTSTPIGVVCIATICVAAGRGWIGESIVVATSAFHCCMSIWFLYMAVFRFRLWPDPGWSPNTIGLGYAAVKTWLYFPKPGLALLCLTLAFFCAIFLISVVRVLSNKKITAPVAWIALSAPSITLYSLTLIAQPTRSKELLLESDGRFRVQNHEWMEHHYMYGSHLLMAFSLVGLATSVYAFVTRWENFRQKPFSPAHVAFCFPTLSHTNAIQAYRGAVNAYTSFPDNGWFKTTLYSYWLFFLLSGTVLNTVFTYKFLVRLPQWTKVDTAGEEEPPPPEETFVQEMLDGTQTHEMLLDQPFVNPAVLQANEAGALVRVRRGTADYQLHGPYMRTRRVQAHGFDPTMSDDEFRRERAELLDWVANNAPRTRHRTMSNQSAILQAYRGTTGPGGGNASSGIYGSLGGRHKRSATSTGVPGM